MHETPTREHQHEASATDVAQKPAAQTFARNPNSPSGQFGMSPVQMQDKDKSPKEEELSDEGKAESKSDKAPDHDQAPDDKPQGDEYDGPVVPVLGPKVSEQIQKMIDEGAGEHRILDAILPYAEKHFGVSRKHLEGGNMNQTMADDGDSHIEGGIKFEKWLETELLKFKADIAAQAKAARKRPKTITKKMVRAHIDTLKVPKDVLQFRVKISPGEMSSVVRLWNAVGHEMAHVRQKIADPFRYITSFPKIAGIPNPSKTADLKAMEVEVYLWELENMNKTGLMQHPDAYWWSVEMLKKYWAKTSKADQKKLQARYDAVLQNAWVQCAESSLKMIEKEKAALKGQIPEGHARTRIEEAARALQKLFPAKGKLPAGAGAYKARKEAALQYAEEIATRAKYADFEKIIDGYTKIYPKFTPTNFGYAEFTELMGLWDKLDEAGKKILKPKFHALTVPFFDKVCRYLHQRFMDEK
ncbi:MAG: hypothetical protein AAF570_20005, partial [Bacteroidota bacterium]